MISDTPGLVHYPAALRKEWNYRGCLFGLAWLIYIAPIFYCFVKFVDGLPAETNLISAIIAAPEILLWALGTCAASLNLAYAHVNKAQLFYALDLWEHSIERRRYEFECQCRASWKLPHGPYFTWEDPPTPTPQ